MILGRGGGGLSVAFDMPTLMGRDSDDPMSAGRGRPLRRGDRLRRRHGDALRRHRPRRGHHVDDDQRSRRPRLLHDDRRRRARRRRHRQAQRHPADRHLQGVHRPEGVDLRPRAAPAPDRRPDGVLRREDPGVQAALSVSGYHIREAGSTAAQELAFTLADGFGYVELGLVARPRRRRLRARPVVLLRRPRRLLRGDREVPRRPADLGALAARRLRRRRPRRPSGCGSTPRPPASR